MFFYRFRVTRLRADGRKVSVMAYASLRKLTPDAALRAFVRDCRLPGMVGVTFLDVKGAF